MTPPKNDPISSQDLARERTDWAYERTQMAATRTYFALLRTGLAIAGGGTLVVSVLADGELLGGEAVLIEQTASPKDHHLIQGQAGDLVLAGSTCVQGRAAYRVAALPERPPVKSS